MINHLSFLMNCPCSCSQLLYSILIFSDVLLMNSDVNKVFLWSYGEGMGLLENHSHSYSQRHFEFQAFGGVLSTQVSDFAG